MRYIILIATGLISGLVLGESISILHYVTKIKREEEKKHDRDYKDTQSNKEGDSRFYPVSSEGAAGISVSSGNNNGEPLDITQELAVYSRNVLTQYCNSQSGCSKCCLERDGGCSLISGPPCMWVKKGEENV